MSLRSQLLALVAIAVTALSGCGGGGGSREVVLATLDISAVGSGSGGTVLVTGAELQLSYEDDPPFEALTITPPLLGGEAGVTYETRPSTSPTAASVLGRMANGVAESLGFHTRLLPNGGGGGQIGPEANIFTTRHPSLTGNDLVGSTVTRVVVEIGSCAIATGNPYAYNIQGTLVVMGTLD